ncbi:hypothetical protein Ahy_B02g059903 [Arachis hypogaea]|uniref:Protein FAR1-RELATED SEQUENCE n=1 Tax=Arachis hypogaea TaxID=3818 RepID=A0A445AHI0_ARAHY|nr:hypothetical protein Ahy_B02g059903 [Arachis hypogaea]
MDHSTSDCQLNPGEVDYEFESNEVPEVYYIRHDWFLTRCIVQPLSVVDDELVPKVGMTFTTLEDAGKFYRNYAKAAGFSTRVQCTNRKGNEIKNQLITCSREGKWKSKISPTEKTNPTAGLNCHARIYIHTLKDVGAWIISKVVLDHSHPCCPSKAEMLKQHRELSMSIRRTIENNEEAGIRPSKTYQSFVAAAGGHRELNFIKKDVRNYITREVRNVSEQEDAKEFGKYLGLYANNDSPLVYLAHHEEDSKQIKRVQGKCRYRTRNEPNSFDRNWNDFLLNFGLADNKWLLGNQRCKLHVPSGVFTVCVWVYYEDLYEDRHIWVPIYLDHHFWAGMRSTQRSESMHSFFNKYITRNSSLIQFVKQYDNCLGSREQAERESDAVDFHTVIQCATESSIEAQFQDAYTHAKFREVQAQFRGKANCITRLTNSALGYSVYEVGEQVSSSIFNKFVVTYDSVAAEVKRQCLLFESRGILCRHALSVLSFEQVSQVSPRYILERWSKKVKRRHTHQEQPRRATDGAKKQEVRPIGFSFAKYLRICLRIG